MKELFKVGNNTIGRGHPCLIIAEIAQAHDGSLGTAHAYINAAATAGVDAVKFQTHIADAESTPDERFRVSGFPQDATRFDYWKRMEFSASQWRGLADHAAEKGLIFLSTPFSQEALELLGGGNMPAWKIGSGEISNIPMLEQVAKTGKPVLLSTGMSSWAEIDEAVSTVRRYGSDVAVFQCTSSYPCPPQKIGLNVISELRQRYGCPVGLSDHSGTIFPSLAAVSMGANLIEVHTVFSKECFGPDVMSSVTTRELAQLVEGIRFIESAMMSKISKDEQAAEMAEMNLLFGKSLYIRRDLPRGHLLSEKDVSLKKPGTGIPAKKLGLVLGRRLRRDYRANEQLEEVDLDE